MRVESFKRMNSWFLCVVLIVVMALTTVGCDTNNQDGGSRAEADKSESNEIKKEVLGEGQKQFDFTVVDKDGNETYFEIHSDAELVGDALLALDLIAGDASEYGLFVKSVNGITADYDIDQTYWAFYVNGEYATSGVDTTAIEEGATYSFRVEK